MVVVVVAPPPSWDGLFTPLSFIHSKQKWRKLLTSMKEPPDWSDREDASLRHKSSVKRTSAATPPHID